VSASAWSKSLPAEVGAYWFKPSEDGNGELVFVQMRPFVGRVPAGTSMMLAVDTVAGARPVNQLGGFWAGPLLPPNEDQTSEEDKSLTDHARELPMGSLARAALMATGRRLAVVEKRLSALEARCTNTPS
jgi:hypothetical protein